MHMTSGPCCTYVQIPAQQWGGPYVWYIQHVQRTDTRHTGGGSAPAANVITTYGTCMPVHTVWACVPAVSTS